MRFLEHPASLRVRELAVAAIGTHQKRSAGMDGQAPLLMAAANATLDAAVAAAATGDPSHPDFLHLAGLVCEAVLEVVFVALPGFVVAYTGMFDAASQKFVAELNMMVFTPCLVFTKLASQLNADKLADLVVIPFIFVAQTLVSWLCGQAMARLWGFGGPRQKRQRNFILAMAVFGNSNSLPISLVLSLSKTIEGLHWDKVPGDNDDEVAARGILYLLIFQQLGQLVRWTWGYSVLLKPAYAYDADEGLEEIEGSRVIEEGEYRDEPDDTIVPPNPKLLRTPDSAFSSGSHTPGTVSIQSDSDSSESEEDAGDDDRHVPNILLPTAANGSPRPSEPGYLTASPTSPHRGSVMLGDRSRSTGHITTFPNYSTASSTGKSGVEPAEGWKKPLFLLRSHAQRASARAAATLATFFHNLFRRLPAPVQKVLATLHYYNAKFWAGVWRQMNPPLWAMLIALVVASIPKLQHLFFDKGTLINNSVTRAVSQTGGVAVPLILVVLGANLARTTLPQDQLATTSEEKREERKLLCASLLARMVLPTIVMAPFLALVAKYVPISILDDPIFVIVCFLLTGAPSALQLAQICQVNGVFMGAMSSLLVASYVVAIFPSTLVLVMLALEVLQWAV